MGPIEWAVQCCRVRCPGGHNGTAMYVIPFQGRHLAAAYNTCPCWFKFFNLKALAATIGSCRLSLDHGRPYLVAKVIAIAATLPSYSHGKYCGAFLVVKYDYWRNTSKRNNFTLIFVFYNLLSESLSEKKWIFPEFFSGPKWLMLSWLPQNILRMSYYHPQTQFF